MKRSLSVVTIFLVACWTDAPGPAPIAPKTPSARHELSPGNALVEVRTGYGGVISLHGERSAAMKRADMLMAQHCGKGLYTIVREGEEVIESETTTTEWRLHYECNRRP